VTREIDPRITAKVDAAQTKADISCQPGMFKCKGQKLTIKIEMLRYFTEVARAGNLADAAKKLGRSPSAVSMMLKQMEEDLGAPLFETDRKSKLTTLGEYVLAEASRELTSFDHSVISMQHFANAGEAQIRIACLPDLSAAFLPEVCRKLHKTNPLAKLWVRDMMTDAGIDQVALENVDIAIVNTYALAGHQNLRSAPLLSDRFGIVCRRDSAIGRKDPVHWSDLALEKLIFTGICRAIDDPYVRQASEDSLLSIENAQTILSFVKGGKGVSVLPEAVKSLLPDELIFRLPEAPEYRRTAHLVWNANVRHGENLLRLCEVLHGEAVARGMGVENYADGKGWIA